MSRIRGTLETSPSGCFLCLGADDRRLLRTFLQNSAGVFWAFLFCGSAFGVPLLDSKLQRLEAHLSEIKVQLQECPALPLIQSPPCAGFHSGFAKAGDAARWVQVDLGEEYPIDSVFVIPATLNGNVAYGFPQKYRLEMGRDALLSEPELLIEASIQDTESMLPRIVACGGKTARYVRFTALSLVPQPRLESRFIFCLGELLVFSGGRNVALHSAVLAPNSVRTPPTWAPSHLVDGVYPLGIPSRVEHKSTNGWHSGIFDRPDSQAWVQADFGKIAIVDEIRLIPAHPPDYPDRMGFGFPRRFKVETSLSADFSDAEPVFDTGEMDFDNPSDTKVSFRVAHRKARFVRVTASALWERSSDFVFALGELEVYEGNVNVARSAQVIASSSTKTALWKPEFLVDGIGGGGALLEEEAWLRGLAERRRLSEEKDTTQAMIGRESKISKTRIGVAATGSLFAAMILAIYWVRLSVKKNRRREVQSVRAQIARDLHDEIGSNLCSIRLISEMGCAEAGSKSPIEVLSEIRNLAEEGTDALRDMVWLVRDGENPKVEWLVEKMRAVMNGLAAQLERQFHVKELPEGVCAPFSFQRDLLFVFREALHNVVSHSGAAWVVISLRWGEKDVELVVEDGGKGFDSGRVQAGEGIENMRYRCGRLKGCLLLESSPNKGTKVAIKVPRP